MTTRERDPYTGHMTTGHIWNGIKELNTPVPLPVWLFLSLFFAISLVCWILLPTWPLGTTYTHGILGIDRDTELTQSIKAAAKARASWEKEISDGTPESIQADTRLMTIVRETGRTLFQDNCAVCHGTKAEGGPGFPRLTDKAWLWGGKHEDIAETIRVGINSNDPDTRSSEMPAFGRDEMLSASQINTLIHFIRSIARHGFDAAPADGKSLYTDNCAACHGETGEGNVEMGAPDLVDSYWLYGGDHKALLRTIWGGRKGHMPNWDKRLGELELKILSLYVYDLAQQSAGPGQ